MTPELGPVLSIEDNDTDFMTLEHALRSAGVKNPVKRWEDGRIAMNSLSADAGNSVAMKAALILLDLNLPGVDGLQLLRALRALDRDRRIPVLILSTSSHSRDIDACYLAGANGYVIKPLELNAWETRVGDLAEKWLRRSLKSPEAQPKAIPTPKAEKTRATKRMREKFARDMRRAQLTRTIECEIIPRLLLAHGCSAQMGQNIAPIGAEEARDEVAELVQLVLASEMTVAASYVESKRIQGATLETLFQALIVPAARLIGDMWKADICSFHEFSEALSRLQVMLAELTPATEKGTLH
ncbi:response regulator [Hyphomicrobium sp.]|uniref:response regulator n=1 Tax=Hyphomicrobium sp. TaxID=82 RepID=UPI000FB989F1|nr:response regulator [Hyphomicrobium sp.]RUP00585.1 MAG: hybrid sensor histidine kinase/response regulator [Hyphomicrobium sp.]